MGRSYKRDSSGRFAGGGGTGRVSRALARVGVRKTAYNAATFRAKRARQQRTRRALQRQLSQDGVK